MLKRGNNMFIDKDDPIIKLKYGNIDTLSEHERLEMLLRETHDEGIQNYEANLPRIKSNQKNQTK